MTFILPFVSLAGWGMTQRSDDYSRTINHRGGRGSNASCNHLCPVGDYSSWQLTPLILLLFGIHNNIIAVTADFDWHTRVAAFSFAGILTAQASAAFPAICPGQTDQLDVEVSGGTGSYTYSWTSDPAVFSTIKNPTVSPLVATQYFVVVSSGNQIRTDSYRSVFAFPVFNRCRWRYSYAVYDKIPLQWKRRYFVVSEWSTSGDGTFLDSSSLSTY